MGLLVFIFYFKRSTLMPIFADFKIMASLLAESNAFPESKHDIRIIFLSFRALFIVKCTKYTASIVNVPGLKPV